MNKCKIQNCNKRARNELFCEYHLTQPMRDQTFEDRLRIVIASQPKNKPKIIIQ